MLTENFDADRRMSAWLRKALKSALERDPVEAANDAELLRAVLHRRVVNLADGKSGLLATRTAVRISKRRIKRPVRTAQPRVGSGKLRRSARPNSTSL